MKMRIKKMSIVLLILLTGILCGCSKTTSIDASGICGKRLKWKLFNDGKLVISGKGQMYDYDESNPAPWKYYYYEKQYTSPEIILQEGVESIGNYAFYDCWVADVSMPDSLASIGECAFYQVPLTSVMIPQNVSSIGRAAFAKCYILNSINIPDGVLYIEDFAFEDCNSITSITLPDSVVSMVK